MISSGIYTNQQGRIVVRTLFHFLDDGLEENINRKILDKYRAFKIITGVIGVGNRYFAINAPYVSAVNEFAMQEGYEVINQADLEQIRRENLLNIEGKAFYTSLVLASLDKPDNEPDRFIPNRQIAEGLRDQLGFDLSRGKQAVIPISELELVRDRKLRPYGLGFKLKSRPTIFATNMFARDREILFRDDYVDKESGLPVRGDNLQEVEDGMGYRSLFSLGSGLSVLTTDIDGSVGCWNPDMFTNYKRGRIILKKVD